MFHGLFIASLIASVVEGVGNARIKPIPAENWENKDLYYKDIMSGMSPEQRMENLKNGKYKLTQKEKESYKEPHRTANGKIIIENSQLYNKDVREYGAYQAHKWAERGKYNLTSEELKKEKERIKKELDELCGLL